jgi:hypothetical protein
MALRDEEQRQLAEIERRLAADDPRLAQRLARLRPLGLPRTVLGIVGVLAAFVTGLVIVIIGAETTSLATGIAGVIIAVGFPTLIIWRFWLRRLN